MQAKVRSLEIKAGFQLTVVDDVTRCGIEMVGGAGQNKPASDS